MAAVEWWDEGRKRALGITIWLFRGGCIGCPSIRGHHSNQCDRWKAPLINAKSQRVSFQGCRRGTVALPTAANYREVKYSSPFAGKPLQHCGMCRDIRSCIASCSRIYKSRCLYFTCQTIRIFGPWGWWDRIVRWKLFFRARRYQLHLHVKQNG